jgi:hypothetical protein
VDLRGGLKESLVEMGYQVWASEFPDFPVDSSLHAQDTCLRNVDRADQYVLVVNDRYGAPYEGEADLTSAAGRSETPGQRHLARVREAYPNTGMRAHLGISGTFFRRYESAAPI